MIYSVSELSSNGPDAFGGQVHQRPWSRGEITDFKHHSSGHMYFSLKDEKGVLRCAFFKGNNMGVAFKPENGLKVVRRRPDHYLPGLRPVPDERPAVGAPGRGRSSTGL